MLKELATVAAYGASASFGRDVYKSTKEGNPLIWLLLAGFMSIFGFKLLAAGDGRGNARVSILSTIGAVFLIVIGTLIFDGIATVFMVYTGIVHGLDGNNMILVEKYLFFIDAEYLLLSAAIGLAWGGSERREAQRVAAIEGHNMQFLTDNGFQDSGLGDDIVEDGDGNRLKIKLQQDEQILFTVVGRRNVRAAINMDETGRMVDYTGPIRL